MKRKLGPGLYVNENRNELEVDAPELLKHFGLPDTPANRDMVTAQAAKAMAQVFPSAQREVRTSDAEATGRALDAAGVSAQITNTARSTPDKEKP